MKLKLFLALALVITLTACEKKEEVKEDVVEVETEEEVETETEETSDVNLDDTEVLDGVFAVGSETYTLPIGLQAFLDNGFTVESRVEGSTLAGNTLTSFDIIHPDSADVKFKVSVVNYEAEAKPIEEATVKSVQFDFNTMTGNCEIFKFAKGITCSSTPEEVMEAYGEPKEKDTGSENTRLVVSYYGDRSYEENVKITYYDLEAGKMAMYSIQNYID